MSDLQNLAQFLKTSVINQEKYSVHHVIDTSQREYLMIINKDDKFWQEPRKEN